ncbi:MAG: AmmeMemoRadiSam system protein B [Chloroflexi bacterium]|nr:AmmeMemoRadiSam system protein B [Chloroflexota bacterium]
MQQHPVPGSLEPHLNFPRIRPLDVRWVEDRKERFLHLRDPLGLTPGEVFVPDYLAPFLALCDGEHNLATIRAALAVWRGMSLTPQEVERMVRELDEAVVLVGPRAEAAQREALMAYRISPFRQPALANSGYPGDPTLLDKVLEDFCTRFPIQQGGAGEASTPLVGILSPHIDYTRGHKVYAECWQAIAPALADCEQVIVFGTDHAGGPGKVTLTKQQYATPWGVFPADEQLTDTLIHILGEGALEEELHHAKEHSIELAVVWLHHMLRKVKGKWSFRNLPTVVPILCGNMFPYVRGEEDPEQDRGFEGLVQRLRRAMEGKRTLVVAAGDLAHVGPAFGDSVAWDLAARARLRNADEASLDAVCLGDAQGFFQGLKAEGDSRRVCGLTPIYLALRLLGGQVSGYRTGYEQCPADPQGDSLVSIAGVIWRQKP